jgi:hypothetical protein
MGSGPRTGLSCRTSQRLRLPTPARDVVSLRFSRSGLGSFASLWHFVRACVPGLASLRPDQWEALLEDVDLQAPVRREWKPPFGPFPPDIRAFLQRALRLYGPGNDGIHGERVAGTITITNGRHRSCAAFQQGIGVAAMVAQEQTRLDPMAS